tara:strand:- start:88 stop:345 length:258 start_codon:yes stop_codon:yes gene_type:complete
MRKRHTYSSDNVVEEFYKALADKNEGKLRRVHIPRSDVFYVREAIYQDTGTKYSLDRVERAMYLEGMLETKDVFEPERKREWETD